MSSSSLSSSSFSFAMHSVSLLTIDAVQSLDFTCDATMLPKVESSWPSTTIGSLALAPTFLHIATMIFSTARHSGKSL